MCFVQFTRLFLFYIFSLPNFYFNSGCCVYEKPKMFGESSDEDDDDFTCNCRGHKDKCFKHDHDHDHNHGSGKHITS